MIRRIAIPLMTAGFLAFNGTVGISQTAPGTLTNPIKGGATLLQFSRTAVDASFTGGRLIYYQCGGMETQLVLSRAFSASLASSVCDELPDLKASVTGQWNQWIRVTSGSNTAKYQGLHAATLSLIDQTSGALVATLDCRGSNGMGTHHAPLVESAETCAAPQHFEGLFTGQIVNGAYKGAYLQGTYAGDIAGDPVQSEQGQTASLVMEGMVLKACPQRFVAGTVPDFSRTLKSLHLTPAK